MTLDTDMTTQANRLAWDASAARHQASPEWARQIQGFKDPAFATFDPVIDQLLRKQGIEGARAVQAGLQIRQLTEYPHSNREVDYDIYVAREAQLPLCYTLVTEKA